jgi:hypothetical protein
MVNRATTDRTPITIRYNFLHFKEKSKRISTTHERKRTSEAIRGKSQTLGIF